MTLQEMIACLQSFQSPNAELKIGVMFKSGNGDFYEIDGVSNVDDFISVDCTSNKD